MGINYNPKIVTDGIILALDAGNPRSYPGTGEIWTDLSGRGNNATRTNIGGYGGQVTYNSSGFFDFSMNTPTSYATAIDGNGFTMSSVIVPTTGSFTLNAFVRRNTSVKAAGDRETIFSNTSSSDGWRFGMTDTGGVYYLIGGVGAFGYQEGGLGGTSLNNGNWHMMTAVFDRAAQLGSYTIYGYVDGIVSGSVAIAAGAGGNIAIPTYEPGIGYRGCCDIFAGQIATMSAYNRALTAAEVLQNFSALRSRFGI